MYCVKCGAENAPGNKFCTSCGAPLNFSGRLPQRQENNSNFDISVFAHPDDVKALNALKAIPGFDTVMKAIFKVYNERVFYITNMSTNLRLGKEQLPEIYNMLPPICEKLGIDIPELYLELDVSPNAYTSGDNNPFIVVTSGLIDNMPKELIPTVLAHECGHIAFHHTLYHTIGQLLISGIVQEMLPSAIGKLISVSLEVAFFYWMRCSEYSADRAAILCDGSAEKLIEMCMYFSGYKNEEDISVKNKELFIRQAANYKKYVNDSGWNKTLEFFILSNKTHPLNSVRAYEANLWTSTQQFADAIEKFNAKMALTDCINKQI